MKRGLNMPGPCRGACPRMMATQCVRVREQHFEGWGGVVDFVGYPSEEWDPQITACHHLCIRIHWLRRRLKKPCINELVALKLLAPGALLHYNQESKAGAWDPSSSAKWSCVQ